MRCRPIACLLWVLIVPAATAAQARPAPSPAGQIDIDLVRADLQNVLRLLAEVGGFNLVIGEGVGGRVTLKLAGVHWRDALSLVLESHGLELQRRGSIHLVAPGAVFERERERRLTAREQCLASAPLTTRVVRVNHARAASLAPLVRKRLSKRGRVSVDRRTNSLIISDVECSGAM